MEISIIGAGIGGLTTALTLQQRGLKVKIFESSKEIKPVGAGIILANNAMQVFQKLGIHDKIEKAGNRISCMKITDPDLNDLSVVDLTRYEQKYGVYNVAIHRGELQKILMEEIGYDSVELSKKLSKVEKADLFKLTFEDNSTFETQVLIGADGIKSIVRNSLFTENTLRKANQICLRGVCQMNLPQKYENELYEAWGKGQRFGFVKISDTKVYWYALINSNRIHAEGVNLEKEFNTFHHDVLEIISCTKKEEIIVNEIMDLQAISTWQNEHVCLVGDAAHATTPNMGQGACQAIEDAYTLGELLDKGISIEDTFKTYEKLRRKKAHTIVRMSWSIGKIAHIDNRMGVWLRNSIMKMIPKSVNRKQMDMIFKLNEEKI